MKACGFKVKMCGFKIFLGSVYFVFGKEVLKYLGFFLFKVVIGKFSDGEINI